MKSRIIKTVQILFLSLLVSASIFPFLASVASAQAPTKDPNYCRTRDECGTETNSVNLRIYLFIPGPNTDEAVGDLVNSSASLCKVAGTGRCVANTAIKLNVPIPSIGGGMIPKVKNIDEYINAMFGWLLRLGGVIAAVVMVWGGYIYITAAGNQARIGQAKETITGGLIGLILLFGSVTLLGFLNERLLVEAPIYVDKIKKEDLNLGFCEITPIPTNEAGEPSPSTITCGDSVKDTNGSKCLSSYCGGSAAVCVPNILKIGMGFSGEKLGYACVANNTKALIDACEDSPLQHCAYLSKKIAMASIGGTATRCGIGISLCKPGQKLECPDGFPEVLSVIKCNSKSGILGPVTGKVYNGSREVPGRYFIEDKNKSDSYVIYFKDSIKPPKGKNMDSWHLQTAWKEIIPSVPLKLAGVSIYTLGADLIQLGGICCNGNILVFD